MRPILRLGAVLLALGGSARAEEPCASAIAALKAVGGAEITGRSLLEIVGITRRNQVGEFSLEAVNCQAPRLYRKGGKEVPLPADFTAGTPCAGDEVGLAEIGGRPSLYELGGAGTGRAGTTRVAISQWTGDHWGARCRISVKTKALYEIAKARCSGETCGGLKEQALFFDDVQRNPDDELPGKDKVSAPLREKYARMLGLAEGSGLSRSPEGECPGSVTGNNVLFSAEFEGDILLGKIGAQGPNTAIAFYRLEGNALAPMAGFCIVPRHITIDLVERN